MNISIIIPIFNEKKNIDLLIKDIHEKLKSAKFEIIIIDDSSNDGTIEVLKNLEKNYEDLKIIYRKEFSRDLSKSCQLGFDNSKYENILVMDGDLQHDPIYISSMATEFQKYNCDIVVGARDLLTGSIEGLSRWRQIQSKICIKIIDIVLKRKTMDPMSGYFLFKKQIYQKNKSFLFLKGYKILADLIYSSKQNLSIRDVKIEFKSRLKGRSKMSFKIVWILLIFILKKFFNKFLCFKSKI